ncbi:TPA: phage tail protein [Providencia rettgeri]|nr:phage tail protein [Providencia rettgeri]
MSEKNVNEVYLLINGKRIMGWDSIRITRGIERFPSDFELSLMDYYPATDEKQLVKAGDACEVLIGEDKVVTGYIDSWNPAINKTQHQIRVSGRGKCQDLVDCSANWENNVISQSNALQIAKKLASWYDIDVISDIPESQFQNIPQFTLNWGESSQQVIERTCRWSALLYYELPDGSLFLSRAGTEVAASGISQGLNIEEANYSDSMSNRYSEYIGVSLSISPMNGDYSSVENARARDPEADKMRYRNYITIVESNLITARREQEAINWEMNRRYGRSKELRVVIDSWRDVDDQLWRPNTLIPINIPIFGLEDKQWLLSEVVFIRGSDGTKAILTLMPPEAFIVEPYEFYQTIRM